MSAEAVDTSREAMKAERAALANELDALLTKAAKLECEIGRKWERWEELGKRLGVEEERT